MEDYPEELRTPPVPLVSLVGCPELHQSISASLHSQQPPVNTLALPDFTKVSLLARSAKARDPLAPPPPAAGILKKDWLLKHRTRVPAAVAALFRADQVSGDPAQWLQACSDLENLKSVIHGRNTKLVVVLVQSQAGDELSEDLMVAMRKRAEIDSKYLVVLVQNDAQEWKQSLNKLKNVFAELCLTYYREEGRRIKTRIEKRTFASVELSIRYCFKVAVYAEFRQDWAEASRFYEEGFRVLREMIGTSTRLPPTQRLVEIKAVAEQFHFKISTLLLHGGKIVEAITWFRKHIRSYERVVGAPEVAFLHWEWFSRQFLVFGELMETTAAAAPHTLSPRFGTSDNLLTEWEFQPAYYYQLAANYLREKRHAIESSSSMADLTMDINGIPESVMPSVYVGQYVRLFEQGDTVAVLPLSDTQYISYALSEAERFQDSYEIIALFRKAHESFQSLDATRMASACSSGMAIEYYAAGDFSNAKQLFDVVAGLYRQEGWVTLLWENMGYLRECSRKLNSIKDFIRYSLEMAALPVFSGSGQGDPENKSKNGPAGPPTVSRREKIQEEVSNILKRKETPEADDGCNLHLMEESVHLDIDQISPLRMVLIASVAFHDQSVKPGSALLVSVSLLSQLPSPLEIDHLEVQFNQSDCNFVVAQKDCSVLNSHFHGQVVQAASSLTLFTNKWLRLTHEVKSGQSGKLECLSVNATIATCLVICCRAESPASMEDLPMWKFEDRVETFPTKDPVLSFSGQKAIQVEEPEAQVDLVLSSTGPALVGELFVVPVTILSKGHAVHLGELKINLVDAKGGGLLMSPREAEESDSHHVELLSISSVADEEESKEEADNIRKIQYSFGVVSVPTLGVNESWSCKLEIKWHRPKSVMLYVSLGYSLDSSEEASLHRVNVHRSLQIEGKIPMIIDYQFLRPFRREALLLSRIRSSIGDSQKNSLAMEEPNMLIVSARNGTEVPLRLHSMVIEPDNEGNKESCLVQQISGISNEYVLMAPGSEYKGIFSVKPRAINSNFCLGAVCLNWSRDSRLGEHEDSGVMLKQTLPEVTVEEAPLVVTMECPPCAILGIPFTFHVKIHNSTSLLQEIKYSLVDSQNFVFSGAHNHAMFILPKTEHVIGHKLVPLGSGAQLLPRITVTSVRYSAALTPSATATTVFVYPSEPKFNSEQSNLESDE